MKNRILIVAVSLGMVFGMSGCGLMPEIPDLSEEEAAIITEYSAGLLLKHQDVTYGLLSEEELAKAEQAEIDAKEKAIREQQLKEEYLERVDAAKKEKEKNKSDKKKDKDNNKYNSQEGSKPQGPSEIASGKLAEFYGIDGFDVQFAGYEMYDSYPNDGSQSGFAVYAPSGKKLCVVKFNVTNVSGADSEFDMFNKQSMFNLTVNGGQKYQNATTLLADDLSMYKGSVEGNRATEMFLLFEVNDEPISSMSMEVVSGSNTGSMNLE